MVTSVIMLQLEGYQSLVKLAHAPLQDIILEQNSEKVSVTVAIFVFSKRKLRSSSSSSSWLARLTSFTSAEEKRLSSVLCLQPQNVNNSYVSRFRNQITICTERLALHTLFVNFTLARVLVQRNSGVLPVLTTRSNDVRDVTTVSITACVFWLYYHLFNFVPASITVCLIVAVYQI